MALDSKLVKKAYAKVKYTPEQIEQLKNCMDPVTGPMYFMENFMIIQTTTKGAAKFSPFDYQRDLVDVYHGNRYSIALCGRQLGKTTVAAGYLLWYAMFIPDSTILVAAHKREGASEIMTRIRYAYESLPDHIRAGAKEYNKQSLTFDNGSTIMSQATTENTGRGLSLSLVYLDEFAFVEPRIAKEFWTALSPTLSTGGKCIITSTPNSDDDQFAEIWHAASRNIDEHGNETELGQNGFKPYKATWREHPDRDEKWANEERAKVGDERFRREHEAEFIIFDETLINSITLANMQGIDPVRKSGQVRWYKKINSSATYIVALDPAMGTGGDNSAIEVYELPSMEQVAEWQHNQTIIEDQIKILKEICTELDQHGSPEIYWSVENNSVGEASLTVIREIGEESIPGTMLHDPRRDLSKKSRRKGFTTSNKAKLEACAKLKTWVEKDIIKIKSKNLVHELKAFVAKGGSYEAKTGETDDLVMASVLFVRMAMFVATWDDLSYSATKTGQAGDSGDDYDEPLPIGFI